jgi:hypothetical protein
MQSVKKRLIGALRRLPRPNPEFGPEADIVEDELRGVQRTIQHEVWDPILAEVLNHIATNNRTRWTDIVNKRRNQDTRDEEEVYK